MPKAYWRPKNSPNSYRSGRANPASPRSLIFTPGKAACKRGSTRSSMGTIRAWLEAFPARSRAASRHPGWRSLRQAFLQRRHQVHHWGELARFLHRGDLLAFQARLDELLHVLFEGVGVLLGIEVGSQRLN